VTTTRDAPLFYVRAVVDEASSDGVRLDRINERVISMTFSDEERKADKFTLTLDNRDLAMYDEPAFKQGLILDVTWGYPGNMCPARRCVVQSIKGGLTLTVEAVATSILMNKIVRNVNYTNVRRSDVVRELARRAGYGADFIEIEETPIVYETIVQARMTDAQMMKRLSTLEGFEFYVDHLGLHWHSRRIDQTPQRTFRYFTDMTGEIQTFSIDNDITAKKAKKRTRGRDPLNRTDHESSSSDNEDTDGESLGEIVDYVDPETATYTTAAERRTASEDVSPTSAQDAGTAARENRGRFRAGKLVAIQLKLTVVGDPQTLSKTVVRVEGLGQRISGLYYIRKVVSKVGTGFTQELELISNGTGGHARRSRLGDLELPTRGVPTAGNVANDVDRAVDAGALAQEQVLDPETGRYTTVYRSTSSGRVVARRGANGTTATNGEN
jgi:phage protein D